MDGIQYLNILNDPKEKKILNKLPAYLVGRWVCVVDQRIADDLDDGKEEREFWVTAGLGYPTFAEFCKFLKKEARIASNPVNFQHLLKSDDQKNFQRFL